MNTINREDIRILTEHSNASRSNVQGLLQTHIYNDGSQWRQFLKLLLLALGVGFFASGVIFFFAYNWADLHKFAKLGLAQGLLVAMVLWAVFSKGKPVIKNTVLTGASLLVGALFALFGQIYQTGADAYDFFLGWTLFIVVWIVVSDFAPLWVLFVILFNTTMVLFIEQNIDLIPVESIIYLLLFVNLLFWSFFEFIHPKKCQ